MQDSMHTYQQVCNSPMMRYFQLQNYHISDTSNSKYWNVILIFIARCGGTIHVSRYGNTHIRSPNYPSPYGSDQFDCEWNVVGPTGHFLTFSFPEIRLPTTMNCSQTDFIQIKDSPDIGTKIIQNYRVLKHLESFMHTRYHIFA